MEKNFVCPFCSSKFVITRESHTAFKTLFIGNGVPYRRGVDDLDELSVRHYKCPNCEEISIQIEGIGKKVEGIKIPVRPRSLAKKFPSYIPEAIRNDYEEAYLILHLSPRASATLSRRCLQGMIRDFWSVSGKKNLYQEITEIQDRVKPEISRVLKGLKDLGNIGAHMEKDINLIIEIDPDEAEKLLKLIEYLMKEWYINRYESEQLFNDIIGIDNAKKEQKRNGNS